MGKNKWGEGAGEHVSDRNAPLDPIFCRPSVVKTNAFSLEEPLYIFRDVVRFSNPRVLAVMWWT
jgi:hypothetical protein